MRVPVRPFSADSYRYLGEIENEFVGQPLDRTLLDMGTWVYLRDGVVMKDRAPSIGERGYSQTGDFSGIIQRLEQKYYNKILLRNFHSSDFWYDHGSWQNSSNIRQTLLENYYELGKINAVEGSISSDQPYGFGEITILLPRED